MIADQYNAAEDRKLTRKGLQQQERNSKFSRLLNLIQSAQNTQQGMSGAQRLFSLRSPSGV
jgi:hypothetical protein